MSRRVSLILAWLLALWAVGRWYVNRTFDGSDDPYGMLALLLFLSMRAPVRLDARWMYAALLASAYPVSPLVRATLVCICLGRVLAPTVPGAQVLLALSLPVVASLNFYVGYPLRWISTAAAVTVLQAGGRAVVWQGLTVWHRGMPVLIDAPCSGVQMLWWLCMIAAVLASWRRLGWKATAGLLSLAAVLSMAGNAWRIVALVYAGPCAAWQHAGIGLVVFLAMASTLVAVTSRLQGDTPFPPPDRPPRRGLFGAACLLAALLHPSAGQPLQAIQVLESSPAHVLRKVNEPTRALHPASDCYRATGYQTRPENAVVREGHTWGCITASRGTESLRIEQCIWDDAGHSWSDPSQWYWATLLRQTEGPWWTETRVQPLASGP